jgi:hypothetical protein
MEPIKQRRVEKDLDDKVADALRERTRSRQRTFRSVNSITMRLPRFKEGLRDIKDIFDQYGNLYLILKSEEFLTSQFLNFPNCLSLISSRACTSYNNSSPSIIR